MTLDDALAPGERTTIGFDLRIRLPAENDRFGFHQGLALAGTALPTLSVHDDADGIRNRSRTSARASTRSPRITRSRS